MRDDHTVSELSAEAPPRIASRMRFEDPAKFVEFYDKQLSKHIVGLPHPDALEVGTEILVVVSPPGAPDALQMKGVVRRVRPRTDESFRLRVEVTPTLEDMNWMDAYVLGLRTAVDWHQDALESVDTPSVQLPADDAVLLLATTIDTLTYYALLEVEPDVEPAELQTKFHTLTRRYHPDLYVGQDRALAKAVNRVYRRMNEAYAALKSPRLRQAYDAGLDGPPHTWSLRLSSEAAERLRRLERVEGGETSAGDFYWEKAKSLLDGDHTRASVEEAVRLLRLAVTFEPDNEHFSRLLSDIGAVDRPTSEAPIRRRKTIQKRKK